MIFFARLKSVIIETSTREISACLISALKPASGTKIVIKNLIFGFKEESL
jgi:hypothetical protein